MSQPTISSSFIYGIASDSEEGFWNNERGWVLDVEDASRWGGDKILEGEVTLPNSVGNDARFIITNY